MTDKMASPTYNWFVLSAAIPANILLISMGILFSLPPLMLIPSPLASSLYSRTTRLCPAKSAGGCGWDGSVRLQDDEEEPAPEVVVEVAAAALFSGCSSRVSVMESSPIVTWAGHHCCRTYNSNLPLRSDTAAIVNSCHVTGTSSGVLPLFKSRFARLVDESIE